MNSDRLLGGERQALLGRKTTKGTSEAGYSSLSRDGNDGFWDSNSRDALESFCHTDESVDQTDMHLSTRATRSWSGAVAIVCIGSMVVMSSLRLFQQKHYSASQPILQRSHHAKSKDTAIHDILSLNKEPFGFEKAYSSITNEPLSRKSPAELGIPIYNDRPATSLPGLVFGSVQKGAKIGIPLPTNEWYLNLIVGLDDNPGENGHYDNYAGEENRVHSIPYIVDTVGSIVGIRLHYPNIMSYGTVVQSVFVAWHGLTLGTVDGGFTRKYEIDPDTLPSKLGIGIRWMDQNHSHRYIRSSILRGMPYGTMEYAPDVKPVIASEVIAELPVIDGSRELQCGKLDPHHNVMSEKSDSVLARKDVELYFPESDFTWLVFFSRPVRISCFINPSKAEGTVSLPPGAISSTDNRNAFQLHLEDAHDSDEPLIVRIALANNCTAGTNVNFCNRYEAEDQSEFMSVLREHSGVYPTHPFVKYSFFDPEGPLTPEKPDSKSAYLFFDWKAKHFTEQSSKELITFALPHHVDILRKVIGRSSNKMIGHCMHSLHGKACLVKGGLWAMEEELGGLPSFVSPRPANHKAIPALARALVDDIKYSLPENYMKGAGDTYFSGKMLAKLGRIIVIAQELRGLAERPSEDVPDNPELFDIIQACKSATLPTEEDVTEAIDRLRQGVEVWLNGTASAPLTFDNSWGGVVSCGCLFNGNDCDNTYPSCPGYSDPGLNFGQGFYNDHHFHFGYHIYAASILAQYDRDWGRRYFEKVLLLVRDIANPSVKDEFFPVFRQKDWYLGNSWASGIALFGGRPYLNGRNQESSSEAIAAYEGIAMYGSVMMKAFGNGRSATQEDNDNAYTACEIFNIGRFLATTEIRSADRYWHVYSPKRDIIYPDNYKPAVVSMMWDTMCQFQTWFGSAPYLAYGIQLLPLTPVSERRDTDQWLRQLYPSFAESCQSTAACADEGWAILLYSVLASLGHQEAAFEKTLELPPGAFSNPGGNGHSLSNTLWYIASRPNPIVPYDLEQPSSSVHSKSVPISVKETLVDCGCPHTCTQNVLEQNAHGFSCKERIQWLMANRGLNELGACKQVAGNEYPSMCSGCDPGTCAEESSEEKTGTATSGCLPCSEVVCASEMNKCQVDTAPFLCFEGPAKGGCSSIPWPTGEGICSSCCEIFSGC